MYRASKPLLWIPRFWPAIGGVELHSRQLAQSLSETKEIGVLTHSQDETAYLHESAASSQKKVLLDGAVIVHVTGLQYFQRWALHHLSKLHRSIRLSRPVFSFLFKLLLRKQCRNIAKNYSHIHFVYNGLTESAELALSIAQSLKKPFIFTPNICTDEENSGAWRSPRFKRIYQQCNAIIALTQQEKNWLISHGVPAEKISVCPYAPLVTEVQQQPAKVGNIRKQSTTDKTVLFLGRVTLKKGAKLFIDSAQQVWKKNPHTRFVLIGPQEAEMKAYLQSVCDERLLSIEHVSQEEKSQWLNDCDIVCVPSFAESLGVVYLEAWHFKKPVIAQDLPVLREFIVHGQNGLLLLPTDKSIASSINALLEDETLRKRMGEAGQAKLFANYSWDKTVDRISKIYALHSSSRNELCPVSQPIFNKP